MVCLYYNKKSLWEFILANLKQSKKRARQDLKKRLINKRNLSIVKTSVKNFLKLISLSKIDLAIQNYSHVVSVIDKSVSKGVVHKNKAARLKSRLNSKLRIK
ncbi:MAG TPA: 30S ribosomal protein S20 [Candidatus Azoamicus sp. OHIO2]